MYPMKKSLTVVKIGGNIIEDPKALSEFMDMFSAVKGLKVLVHGGGKKATQLSKQLGVSTTMVNGRRITSLESLKIAIMVYAGLVNKSIVAGLQARGCDALGFSGADGNTISATKRSVDKVDFGYVGDVTKVNSEAISKIISSGFTPVFCALTHDSNGQLLNTNADTIAAEVAAALSGTYNVSLYYCFEKNGVLRNVEDDTSVIEQINLKSYQDLLSSGIISEGMLPKMENCFYALKNKVSKVCIGNIYMIGADEELYTTITL